LARQIRYQQRIQRCLYSAVYTAEQNGVIKRSRGVLINRFITLRLEANLPELLWPEIY
jgi:hypothetical protein